MSRVVCAFMIGVMLANATAALAQDDDLPAQDFFVDAFVTDDRPHVGEQLLYVFRYYMYVRPDGIYEELPDFEGFWLSDVYSPANDRIETVGNRQYRVGELFVEISPLEPGTLTIESGVLDIPETVFRDAVRLLTDPITLEVQPLPSGAPDAFNGAVGQFDAEMHHEPSEVTLGQPITVTLTVSGTGNLEQLPAPEMPQLEQWRIYSKSPQPPRYASSAVGGLRFGQKTFEWILVPRQTGTLPFPAVVFVYFDPQAEEYRSVAMSPFSVDVFPGTDDVRQLPLLDTVNAQDAPLLALKSVPSSLKIGLVQPGIVFWLAWLLPPIVVVCCVAWIFERRRSTERRLRYRQTTALKRALARLQTAKTMRPREAGQHIARTIEAYLADKLGWSVKDIRQTDLRAAMESRAVSVALVSSVMGNLEEAEALRYAPDTLDQDLTSFSACVGEALTELDRGWVET